MKLVKKSLFLTSIVALGLAVSGCQKKSNLLKDVHAMSLETAPTQYKTSTLKASFENVRSYQTLGNRYIRYLTVDGKTTVYDYISQKEIFSTEENVSTIYLYSEVILLVTYSSGEQEMLFIDGTVIYEKGNYDNIFAGNIETKYTYKQDNYKEIIAYTYNDEPGKDIEYNYYSIMFKGKKNDNKAIIQDYSSITIKNLTIEDVKKYHAGDKIIEDENNYSVYESGDTLVYYDTSSNKSVLSIDIDGTYETVISKDKALLQVAKTADGDDDFNVKDHDDFYFVDTYLLDLNNGTYKRLDNFDYYLLDSSYSSYTTNYFYFRKVGKVVGNEIVMYDDITVSTSDGKVCNSAKYAYTTSYVDLKNGNYITSYDGKVYITNSNGEIKKVFDGDYSIYPEGKVIALNRNGKCRFIDFKGNYVTDEAISVSYTFAISLDRMYYQTTDGLDHVIKFTNGKIETDLEVPYSVTYTYVDFEDFRGNIYYVSKSNYYITATNLEFDSYGDTISCSLEFRNVNSDELIGTIENITDWSYASNYNDNHVYAKYVFASGTVDTMTNSYTLSIYEIE